MRSRSLRQILFANTSLAIFAPLILVLLFGWLWILPTINRTLGEQQSQLALAIAGQVESFLAVAESHVTTIAQLHPDDLLKNEIHVQHVMDRSVNSVPHLQSIYLVDADGHVRLVSIAGEANKARQDLMRLDMSRNGLFRKTVSSGKKQWSETFLSVVGSGISVAVALPSGPRVLIGEIDLKELSLFLKKITISQNYLLLLLDHRGQVIADQSNQLTAQQINLSNIPLFQEALESGKEQSGSFLLNNITMEGSIQRIPGLNWWVLVAEPRVLAHREVWISIGVSVAALLATAFTVLVAALIFSHRLASRIEALAAHSINVISDQAPSSWPVCEISEIDCLSKNLETLSSAQHERAMTLEREIAERQKAEEGLRHNAVLLEEEMAIRQRTEEALRVKQLQLEELNSSLECRVQEELAKNRDKDALMIQQSRLAAMGEMLSNIAHQWRQPLNELGIMIQMVRYDYEDGLLDKEKVEQFISSSMSTIQYMSNTINDFRDFFKQDRTPRLFSLEAAIENALGLVRASLKHADITVEIDIDDSCMIMGHANELSQAILNIINNARDVLVDRGISNRKISVGSVREGDLARVVIADNAGGISIDIIDKIFDPYFTTRHKSQGTGLGLYMTRMILENKLGGQITVKNSHEGAVFQIMLPCEKKL